MSRELSVSDFAQLSLEKLNDYAFLVVSNNKINNIMTISWGAVGYLWNEPVFIIMVRHSRYSYTLLEEAPGFTVSIPLRGQLEKEQEICGKVSGRDLNKENLCKFSLIEGEQEWLHHIDECDLHVECETIYKQSMEPSLISHEIKKQHYSEQDYHTIYYGKILRMFSTNNIA